MTRILLVRHGETDWNAAGLHQGTTDQPLNEHGRAQLRDLAVELAGERVSAVYGSPLRRSRETAEAIAASHGLDVNVMPDLREISYGLWQGKTHNWCLRQNPGLANRWITDPWTVRFPGGESLDDVASRAIAALDSLCADHPEATVVVSGHGHVNRVLLIHSLRLPRSEFWNIPQRNGTVRSFSYAVDRAHATP